MNKEEYVKKIEDLFTSYYEKQLSVLLNDHPQFGGYTNCAFITMQNDFIIGYIRTRNKFFKRDELTDGMQEEYDRALVQQMFYVLNDGDFHLLSGYDMVSNTLVDMSELEKRYIAPAAKTTLQNAGLLYRCLDCRRNNDYPWRY